MIISEEQTVKYLRVQSDTYRYLKAVRYPMTKIAKHLDLTRQTVTIRFETKTWKANDFLKVIKLINSKK